MSNIRNIAVLFVLVCATPTLAQSAVPIPGVIHKSWSTIESLSQIPTHQPDYTLFLFDLDDTIFDSCAMAGTKAWRRYIANATKNRNAPHNWCHVFSYTLAQKFPWETAENITSSFVKDLQNRGFAVCGLTARDRKSWYDVPRDGIDVLTIEQLLSVGVDFNDGRLEHLYPDLSVDSEYFGGVFFTGEEPKGSYLLHLLQTENLPEKIIFVDDKQRQVESVANALTQLGIPHECYLYTATVPKGLAFSPLIANIQLYYFYESGGQTLLSDEEAALIADRHPEKNAEFYLDASLTLVRRELASH